MDEGDREVKVLGRVSLISVSGTRDRRIAAIAREPDHPRAQGKTERFHQTLQRWLAALPLSVSVLAGGPCSSIRPRNTATTSSPVTGSWAVRESG
jgi:hypothetical protein